MPPFTMTSWRFRSSPFWICAALGRFERSTGAGAGPYWVVVAPPAAHLYDYRLFRSGACLGQPSPRGQPLQKHHLCAGSTEPSIEKRARFDLHVWRLWARYDGARIVLLLYCEVVMMAGIRDSTIQQRWSLPEFKGISALTVIGQGTILYHYTGGYSARLAPIRHLGRDGGRLRGRRRHGQRHHQPALDARSDGGWLTAIWTSA